VALATGTDIVIWDLERRAPIGPRLTGHEKTVYCLDAAMLGECLVLASAGGEDSIRLWDVVAGKPYAAPISPSASTATVAFASWQGRTVLFSGSYKGDVSMWDPNGGRLLGGPFAAHVAPINDIVIGTFGGEAVGVSGAGDSTLVAWRPSGDILTRIDLGAWILSIAPAGGDRILVGTAKGLVTISLAGFSFELL
jgi:WD40 repeat protein